MASRRAPQRSVLINVFGWTLLALILTSGIAALLTASGPDEITLGKSVTLKTSSAALVVMVFCCLCLLALVGYAAKGQIQLFGTQAGPRPGPFERHRVPVMAFAIVIGAIGLAVLILK